MAGPRQTSADKAATPAVEIDGARVLVVEARFYDKYADELLAGTLAVLEEAGCRVDVVTSCFSHCSDNASVAQNLCKRGDLILRRTQEP